MRPTRASPYPVQDHGWAARCGVLRSWCFHPTEQRSEASRSRPAAAPPRPRPPETPTPCPCLAGGQHHPPVSTENRAPNPSRLGSLAPCARAGSGSGVASIGSGSVHVTSLCLPPVAVRRSWDRHGQRGGSGGCGGSSPGERLSAVRGLWCACWRAVTSQQPDRRMIIRTGGAAGAILLRLQQSAGLGAACGPARPGCTVLPAVQPRAACARREWGSHECAIGLR